jgi:hypothetical protein
LIASPQIHAKILGPSNYTVDDSAHSTKNKHSKSSTARPARSSPVRRMFPIIRTTDLT